jgi:TolA-binding protein
LNEEGDYVNIKKNLPVILVVAVIVLIIGFGGYGDIGAVIDSWNKITGTGNQFNAEMDTLDYDTLNFDNPTQTQRELQKINAKINKMQQILDEENTLISEFAGTTVKVTGDANKYANEALTYIRESHNYKVKAFTSIQDMNSVLSEMVNIVASSDEKNINNNLNKIETLGIKIETFGDKATADAGKADEYYNKAYDAIKKLEALQ